MEERSKSALEALLRVREDGAEKASIELRHAETLADETRSRLVLARGELEAHLAERLAFQSEALGAAIRPDALAQRGAYLSVIDTRITSARAVVHSREQEVATAEKACESKRRALVEAKAQGRAIGSRLEGMARAEALVVERSHEDDALEAHRAGSSNSFGRRS